MRILTTITVALLLTASAFGQMTQKLTATKVSEYGLIYNLPKTVFDVTIEAERIVNEPGEYYKYAKKYLDEDNPISERKESWRVKSVMVTSRGVADESERYLMQFKKGTSPYLIVNEQNMPLAINTENVPDNVAVDLPKAIAAQPTPLQTAAAQQVISQEMLQSQSSAKRAELAAQQIYALRQSRTELITGQADQMPPDGQAMQLVLDNIAAQEAALTAMFVGTKQVSTSVRTFSFEPDSVSSEVVIARLSNVNGIVDRYDLSGDPIYLSLEIVEKGELPVNDKTGQAKQFPKGGVAYRIPGKARIAIEYKGDILFAQTFDVAQYGVVFGIDPSIFTDRKAPSYAIFDSETGAVREIGAVKQ